MAPRQAWAEWSTVGRRFTLGIEEEVMLLNASDPSLAARSDTVLPQLSEGLGIHISQETHAAVIELMTHVHLDVLGAIAELSMLRWRLSSELRTLGLRAAAAGIHPLGSADESTVSRASRYKLIADSMRALATREPTMALHVHVGVPDPDDAIRVLRRIRENVPLLLALSANSPFSRGHDTGFASTRTVVFDQFPRTGLPRAFDDYRDYVDAIDGLIASGALPDPTFLWWDVRLQPTLGTVEVRAMDAQSSVADNAPIAALVQSLARLELEDRPGEGLISPEILAENRFLAARDGLDARLVDSRGKLVSVRRLLADLVQRCRPHAFALGCLSELERVGALTEGNGAIRQRTWVHTGRDLPSMVSRLCHQFAAPAPLFLVSTSERTA